MISSLISITSILIVSLKTAKNGNIDISKDKTAYWKKGFALMLKLCYFSPLLPFSLAFTETLNILYLT